MGKRICRSPPGPISPKCASSKRTSSTSGPGSIDARPRAGAPSRSDLSGHPSPDTAKVPAVSVFLGLWRQSCRAAPHRTGRVIGIAAANLTARSGDVQRKLSSSSSRLVRPRAQCLNPLVTLVRIRYTTASFTKMIILRPRSPPLETAQIPKRRQETLLLRPL